MGKQNKYKTHISGVVRGRESCHTDGREQGRCSEYRSHVEYQGVEGKVRSFLGRVNYSLSKSAIGYVVI